MLHDVRFGGGCLAQAHMRWGSPRLALAIEEKHYVPCHLAVLRGMVRTGVIC